MNSFNNCPICNHPMIQVRELIGCSINYNKELGHESLGESHYYIILDIIYNMGSGWKILNNIMYEIILIDRYMITRGYGYTNIDKYNHHNSGTRLDGVSYFKKVLCFNKFNTKEKIDRLVVLS